MVVLVAPLVHHVKEALIVDPAVTLDRLLFLLDDTGHLTCGNLPDIDMVLQSILLHVGEIFTVRGETERRSFWSCEIITDAVLVYSFIVTYQLLQLLIGRDQRRITRHFTLKPFQCERQTHPALLVSSNDAVALQYAVEGNLSS